MFNEKRFMDAQFRHRTEVVPVPALKDWFDGDADPEWEVRGIDANELARANEAKAKQENIGVIVEALTSSKHTGERVKKVQQALGLSDDVPGEIAKRLEMLVIGSVSPEVTMECSVKLAATFPIEFYLLTNKITILTGLGKAVEGKPEPSGDEEKSKTS